MFLGCKMNNIRAALLLLLGCSVSMLANATPITFEDTSEKLGFTRGTETWGIAWGELNNDNWPDLWNSGHRDYPRLYRNTGTGDFNDVTMVYDHSINNFWLNDTQADTHGSTWADFDNDGDDDILTGDEDELFINQFVQGGLFEQSRLQANQQYAAWNNTDGDRELESDTSCGSGAGVSRGGQYILLFDVDVDGDMDEVCGAEGTFPSFIDNADNNLIPTIGLVNDATIADFNNDLRTDIVVTRGVVRPNGSVKVNDNRIEAWFANRDREFTFSALGEVLFLVDGGRTGAFARAIRFELDTNGATTGSAHGIDISYNQSAELWTVRQTGGSQGYVRVIAQNSVSEPVSNGLSGGELPINSGHGVNTPNGFEWVNNTGLNAARNCVTVVAADFDNDMDVDLYMGCRSGARNLANKYFDNNGDGTFTEVTGHGGEGPVGPGLQFGASESAITADYDGDGFMDIAISNGLYFYPVSLGGEDTLIRNQGNANHWIELDLNGTVSPRAAIGAKVFVTAGGVTQLREQSGGYHRWSQNHTRIHVGLAGNTVVDEIRVEWPSGEEDIFTNVAADQLYEVEENGAIVPAVFGPDATEIVQPGQECGQPLNDPTLGPVLEIWRVCGTDNWRLRARGGLGRLTEDRDLTITGNLVGSSNFGSNVSTASTVASDVVDNSNSRQIDFQLTVQQEDINIKGFNFNTNGQASTCLTVTGGVDDFEIVYLGALGHRIDLPYDLSGLEGCSLDNDGDGITDAIDEDDDNDGVLDTEDAFPFDAGESADSDGDGVGDNADAFPNDPNETRDSDGDGVGDNADAFPFAANETADSDGDGVGDNADEFPNNPNETVDSDGDGVGDNGDVDSDNDGISDSAEAAAAPPSTGGSTTIQLIDDFEVDAGWVLNPFGTDQIQDGAWEIENPQQTNINGLILQRDITPSGVNALITDGNAGAGPLSNDIDGGPTTILSPVISVPALAENLRFQYFLAHDTGANATDVFSVSVVTNGAQQVVFEQLGTNGQRPANYSLESVDISAFAGQSIQILVLADSQSGSPMEASLDDLEFEVGSPPSPTSSNDMDGDGIANANDLDSDNDGIADVVEAGLPDVDNNFIVDDLVNDQGAVSSPVDTDGDGIPDFLDLESNNAANDGTNFDISGTANAVFDTNGDGTLNSADTGGGVDNDLDGIDDLIDRDPSLRGNDEAPTVEASCGEPVFNRATEQGIFLWRDCPTDNWMFTLSAGGVSGTIARGSVASVGGFNNLSQLSFEPNDVLDDTSVPGQLLFELGVGGSGIDGVGFRPVSDNACFTVDSNAQLFLGANRVPVQSPLNLTTLGSCDLPDDPPSCGAPDFDATSDRGIYLWRDCPTNDWMVRLAAGGVSGTFANGNIESLGGFTNLSQFSLEPSDVFENVNNPDRINFELFAGGTGQDGIGFNPTGADACFVVDSNAPLFLGADAVPFSSPLNLDTLASCSVPVDPPQCGEPVFDRTTDAGVFLWQDCAAGGSSDSWFLRVSGGGLPFDSYVGSLASTNLVTVQGTQLEANDQIDGNLLDNGLDFQLNVANSAIDGLNIQIPAGSQTCFEIQQLPSLANVFVGRFRLLMNGAFNLEDLGVCQ